jgi:hypothetical protein
MSASRRVSRGLASLTARGAVPQRTYTPDPRQAKSKDYSPCGLSLRLFNHQKLFIIPPSKALASGRVSGTVDSGSICALSLHLSSWPSSSHWAAAPATTKGPTRSPCRRPRRSTPQGRVRRNRLRCLPESLQKLGPRGRRAAVRVFRAYLLPSPSIMSCKIQSAIAPWLIPSRALALRSSAATPHWKSPTRR